MEQQTWSTTRSRASAGETELIAGLDPAFQSALVGSLTSEVRLFATLLGLNSFLLTSPNEVVAALTHMRKGPEHLNFAALVFEWLQWIHQMTQVERNGPAAAFGGPNPMPGCMAFAQMAPGSVRIYGGSRGYCEPGCELAEFGEPFASSVDANVWLHFVYATAEEAFAIEEVRV